MAWILLCPLILGSDVDHSMVCSHNRSHLRASRVPRLALLLRIEQKESWCRDNRHHAIPLLGIYRPKSLSCVTRITARFLRTTYGFAPCPGHGLSRKQKRPSMLTPKKLLPRHRPAPHFGVSSQATTPTFSAADKSQFSFTTNNFCGSVPALRANPNNLESLSPRLYEPKSLSQVGMLCAPGPSARRLACLLQ